MPIYNNITTRHNGLFQGWCPRSTDRKLTPISLARCTISSQSDMETNSSSRCYSVRIWFQTIIIQNFVHQQGTTKHKVQGEVWWKSIRLKIMAACACHHPDSALYWLECGVTLKIVSRACRFLLLLLQELVLSNVATRVSHELNIQSFCIQWHSNVAKMRMGPQNSIQMPLIIPKGAILSSQKNTTKTTPPPKVLL